MTSLVAITARVAAGDGGEDFFGADWEAYAFVAALSPAFVLMLVEQAECEPIGGLPSGVFALMNFIGYGAVLWFRMRRGVYVHL